MPDDQIKWRLPERWTVTQSGGQTVTIEVTQDANTLVGTASPAAPLGPATGTMSGSVDHDIVTMTIYWPDNSVIDYHGTVSGEGLASGTATARSGSAPVTQWFAEQALTAWN